LRLRLDVQLITNRRFWFDAEDAELRQLYELEYTRSASATSVEEPEQRRSSAFGSLFAGARLLGVSTLPVIDARPARPRS